jgi:pre-rRNA-processing protein TSR3
MQSFPPTYIIRHRKENLKKCSLAGLEGLSSFRFLPYPLLNNLPDLSNYLLLAIDGQPLERADAAKGLLLLDATWRYADKMRGFVDAHYSLETRSIPPEYRTAYPRKQTACTDPERGLASVEALYIAYKILGRETEGLLDHYYWKKEFLSQIANRVSNPIDFNSLKNL